MSLETKDLIDVIVPVYRGLAETRRCLESVLSQPQQCKYELIVINDASPEPELAAWLDELAATQRITLLRHTDNAGFVVTANRGLALHPQRNVVLLNSDTEVNGDWLDRLIRCARTDERIGTVTPFSNNATICSYPRFCEENDLPEELSLAELDGLFAEVNAGQAIAIPTAVGFCMYIARSCLEQTGYFDEPGFGRGYGEENDFCRRAADIGFTHLLCANTFVYHQGAVSFGGERVQLSQQALAVLENRYAGYGELIAAHVATDPARLARRRVDLARLLRSPRPRLLLVTHNLLGGTEKHVQDLARLLESQCEVLILRPSEFGRVVVEWARYGEEFRLYFNLPGEFDVLIDFLQKVDCGRIHFHHLIGFPPLIATLPKRLAVSYDYTLHDYFAICPQVNLTLADGRYCGEPDEPGCNTCLAARPAPWRLNIASWREFFSTLLQGADRVFAPSQDTLGRYRRYFPAVNFWHLPHPEFRQVNVLVLGRLSPAKGGWQLEACARDAKRRRLPLLFQVLGAADYDRPSSTTSRVLTGLPLVFSGDYEDSTLSSLIATARADVIYFPALWPETYSYTLSAALQTGLPIVAPSLGAFPERLASYSQAHLIHWDSAPALVNDLLFQVAGINQSLSPDNSVQVMQTSARYLEIYWPTITRSRSVLSHSCLLEILDPVLAPWQLHVKLPERPIHLLGRNQLIAVLDELTGSIAVKTPTVESIINWRNRLLAEQSALREELDQQRLSLETVTSRHRTELTDKYDSEIHRLNGELSYLKYTVDELYASTSWKITKPLRIISIKTAKLRHSFYSILDGDKKRLFKIIAKYRNRLNKFRHRIQQQFPNISCFFIEPPLYLVRWFFRPIARIIFYKIFNDMLYEATVAPPFSKFRDTKIGLVNDLPHFNPSECFENSETSFAPKVTIIVPSYNHDQFLRKRLDSIYQQTYRNFNVILLDDCSSDSSKEILNEYMADYPAITKAVFNSKNTGNIFLQWKNGINIAEGDLIWIAETDDFCDKNFLETLVPFFMDETIHLAYAKSVFIGEDDQPIAFAFDDYLSELNPEKWLTDYVESAHNEVINFIGKKNTIPNVSSVLFRKPQNCPLFSDKNWLNMKICGDWVFYLYLLRGAKIAFTNRTLNYYRFHTANSSTGTYKKSTYYKEHEFVAKTIAQLYPVPDDTLYANRAYIERFWEQNIEDLDKSYLDSLYNMQEVLKEKSERLPNILMVAYSFSTGGGEIFPIRLANELKKKGYGMTFFNFNRESVNTSVKKMLSSDIPIYECTSRIGNLDKMLEIFGIEIIHTHHASTEHFFATHMKNSRKNVKHIATMHGMYETLEAVHINNNLPTILHGVDLWVYIAEKNLELFKSKQYYDEKRFIKIGNGMEPPHIYPLDRKKLEIPGNAFVLCQASRAMPEKGWEEAISIITEARNLCGKDIHLLLLGDGVVYQSLRSQQLPNYIHLLGFKTNPVDYYAISDMGFLPSRFHGESFPLSIIECLFAGKPFIASNLGEIRSMLNTEDGMAGAVFDLDHWEIPIKTVAQLVADFAENQEIYNKAKALTQKVAGRFDIKHIVSDYEKAYKKLLTF